MARDAAPAAEPDDRTWESALDRVVQRPDALTLALQPIVDLHRGVIAGHEVLARPAGPPDLPPDRWFAAAERLGRSGPLAASVLRQALTLLDDLPANTFLTVNLEPGDVTRPEVREVLGARTRLDRLVVEVTERAVIDETSSVTAELAELRARGATVAVDDAGAGYAGLQALLAIRPQLIKLDRTLISGIDGDPAKRTLLRALGDFAADLDAWVLAEGIETVEELEELVDLEVPLGQGYLLGRPAPDFSAGIAAPLIDRIQARLQLAELTAHVAALVKPVEAEATGPVLVDCSDTEIIEVVLDEHRRPVHLRSPGQPDRRPLIVKLSDRLDEVARRVAHRRDGWWRDPVVVIDGQGTYRGAVTVPRLLEALAR